MNWTAIAISLLMMLSLLLVIELVRVRGSRCPTCKIRLRKTGLTQIVAQGVFSTWVCLKCGARFYGDPPKECHLPQRSVDTLS